MMKKLQAPFVIVLLIILDQFTKWLAWANLRNHPAFPVIPGIFELSYLENRSAAFGIDPVSILQKIFHFSYFENNPNAFLNCKMIFFILLTGIVCGFLLYLYHRIPKEKHFYPLLFMILLFVSGAIGNCIDRILHRYVIDFLYFRLINFPVFNVADIYVTVGAVVLIILWIFYYSESDLQRFGRSAH